MKKILFLIISISILVSCDYHIIDLNEKDYYVNYYRTNNEQSEDSDNNSTDNRNPESSNNRNNNNGRNNGKSGNISSEENNETVYSEERSLTFNVYLYKQVHVEDTILIEASKQGGTVYYNIYTDNLYISMYGFSKYDTDFYVFSNEEPYCGYSSFSLDTKPFCQYKMIVKENTTNKKRSCHGYWALNDGFSFYRAFHVILIQDFN